MRRIPLTADAPPRTHPGHQGPHSCRECPVCGTEECRVLSQLGMYCETAQAAQGARAPEVAPGRRAERRAAGRRR